VRWDGEALNLLDQRRLPDEVHIDRYTRADEVRRAIAELRVRGAPAIGIAAAYGLVLALAPHRDRPPAAFLAAVRTEAAMLRTARPTAVNLTWALDRVMTAAQRDTKGSDPSVSSASSVPRWQAMRAEAVAIHEEDRAMCRAIGEHGVHLIRPGCAVLTHCNAGALAVSELGTATAPMYLAHARGVPFRVVACETRPLLQGARLTAWELSRAGIDVTVICDSAAAHAMAAREVDLVIVGADRVTRNGDVVNKIGTSALAVLAKHFGIPFYVACPSSTLDSHTATGTEVTIEERGRDEVATIAGRCIVPEGVKVRNPAFDVTPGALVTAIITDRGLLKENMTEAREPSE
jgi:methylthioribose-1-phosphate isomerase